MKEEHTPIVNVEDAPEEGHLSGEHFGGYYKVLTTMGQMGHLGVNLSRLPPGRVTCPFHTHQLEDEVFYILQGTGVLRYGDQVHPLRAGDCVSCPAGTGVGHQIANTGDQDLSYLAIGYNDPNEVCTYPDSGKVMVRSLKSIGTLDKQDYMHAEPDVPRVFAMAAEKGG